MRLTDFNLCGNPEYMKRKFIQSIFILVFFSLTSCLCPHKFSPNPNPPEPQPFAVPEKIRVAVVLGSGGVRGMAHVGVLEVLEEAGVPIDIIVGCSAGSLVGSLYCDNPCIEDVKEAVSRLKSHHLLDFDIWNSRYGLCQGRTMRKILDDNLEATTFKELKIPLVVVATDLNSGELVPIAEGDLVKAVEASCSIPFVFVPIEFNGRILVDGGTINPVPVMVAKDLHPDIIIAVDLCELLPPTFPSNLFSVFMRSAEIAFTWQNEVCTRHADVVIRPKMCDVGTFNDEAKYSLYCAGKAAAEEALPQIKKLLEKFPEHSRPSTRKCLTKLNCYYPDYLSCRHWVDPKENEQLE